MTCAAEEWIKKLAKGGLESLEIAGSDVEKVNLHLRIKAYEVLATIKENREQLTSLISEPR